jgi:DNA modification methylase
MVSRLIQGDANLILPTLDSESADGIITDPPYTVGALPPITRNQDTGHFIQDADSLKKYPPIFGNARATSVVSSLGWFFG